MRRELARVEADIALCDRCFGMEPRLPARFERPRGRGRILLLGERPARSVLQEQLRLGLGNPDPGTRFLLALLQEARIPRSEIVIGSAILCRPCSRELESCVPASACARQCIVHVKELVAAVEPRLIVSLGGQALRSLKRAFPSEPMFRQLGFPDSVGATRLAGRTYVHVLYHATIRARVTRSEPEQRRDWRALGRLWEWISSGERGPMPRANARHPAAGHGSPPAEGAGRDRSSTRARL